MEKEIDHAIRAGSSTGPGRTGSFVDKKIINMSVGVNRNRTQTAGTAPVGQRRRIPKHNSVSAANQGASGHKKIISMHQMHIGEV